MLYDFHTHSSLSDGSLSPMELIWRSLSNGYKAVAITDHAGIGYLDRIIREVAADCALARQKWPIQAIPGVELTYVPPDAIHEAAKRAKELGAWLVVVHGETIVEPVEKGTNEAALTCPYVDILAHPGLITKEEAQLAASNGVFLEISARKGHSLTNGQVARLAQENGAKLLLNSDAHDPADILTPDLASRIILGAGIDQAECDEILTKNPQDFIETILQKNLPK
ncbi:MAG: histidinol phosphate phosphatase domain-containing protein [Chloroflexota bacterium]|nr:histidinol phosphate phosphatase domain-containing protein [Chloroflexota bacterium]